MSRSSIGRSVAVIAGVSLVASPADTLDCIDYSQLPGLIGRDTAVTSSGGVVVAGDLALVAGESDPRGLWIVDVADPHNPVNVGFAPLPGSPRAVAVREGVAFVACDWAGVQILDISVPASPVALGSIPTVDSTEDLVIAGDILWIADGTSGFAGFDVTDPAAPLEVARESAESVELLDVDGPLLVAMWQRDDPRPLLWTWDITDPSSPVLLGGDETAGCAWYQHCTSYSDLELRGGVAYAVASSQYCLDPDNCYEYGYSLSLRRWDLADPSHLVGRGLLLAQTRDDGISGAGLSIEGDRAYVTGSTGAVFVVDLSDPLAPERIHTVVTGAPGRGVAARSTPQADQLFVADAGFSVYDVSHPELPDATGGNGVDAYLHDVAELGGIAYTLGSTAPDEWPGSTSIRGWDLTDPASPVQLFGTSGAGYGYSGDLEVANGDLYRSGFTSQGASLFRSEILAGGAPGPQSPVFGYALDSEPSGSHLLVASGESGLAVLETFPDDIPNLVAQVGSDAYRVVADGDLAIVLQGVHWAPTSVIHTVDISDPAAPAFVGQIAIATPSVDWIAQQGGLAVAGGSNLPYDVHLIDVSVPAAPVLLSSLALPGESTDGSFSGSTLYAVLRDGGCVAIDVSEPTLPVVRGTIPTDPATAVLARSGFVLACEGGRPSGLPADCLTSVGVVAALPASAGLRVAPNPFRGTTTILYDLPATGTTRVGVYDARGRRVRDFAPRAGGASALVWDGRDGAGRSVAPGVYFLRLESGGRRVTTKVTRLQ